MDEGGEEVREDSPPEETGKDMRLIGLGVRLGPCSLRVCVVCLVAPWGFSVHFTELEYSGPPTATVSEGGKGGGRRRGSLPVGWLAWRSVCPWGRVGGWPGADGAPLGELCPSASPWPSPLPTCWEHKIPS